MEDSAETQGNTINTKWSSAETAHAHRREPSKGLNIDGLFGCLNIFFIAKKKMHSHAHKQTHQLLQGYMEFECK